MPITIYPGSMKKRNANGSYSDLVPAIATDPEVLDDFAEEYSTSETYNIGDYCIHNSDLYKCNTNNTTGTWNINAWDRVTVGDELVDHKNTVAQLDTEKADEESLALRRSGATNTGAQIETGTFFYLDGTLKRAIATIAKNAPFTEQNCETVMVGALNSIKETTVTATTDNIGNGIIFSGKIVDILGLLIQPGGNAIGVPFYGYGNTYGKFFTASTATLDPVVNTTFQVKVIYRE